MSSSAVSVCKLVFLNRLLRRDPRLKPQSKELEISVVRQR